MSGTIAPICAGILSTFWPLVWLLCWRAYLVIINSTIAKKINYLGQKAEHVHTNPMRKFNETRIKTRVLGPQLLRRAYSYGEIEVCNTWGLLTITFETFFLDVPIEGEKTLSFYIWYILITSRISIGLPYNKGDTFKIKMYFQKYEVCCGHKKKFPYALFV